MKNQVTDQISKLKGIDTEDAEKNSQNSMGERPTEKKRELTADQRRKIIEDIEIEHISRHINEMIRKHDRNRSVLPEHYSSEQHFFGLLKEEFRIETKPAQIELITVEGIRKLKIPERQEIITPLQHYKTDEKVHIITNPENNVSHVSAICTDEFYRLFSEITRLDKKLCAMKQFLQLSKAQQQRIIDQYNGRKYAPEDDDSYHLKGLDQFRLKYDICKRTYTPSQRKEIERLFSCYPHSKSEKILEYALNISPSYPDRKTLNYNELQSILDKHLYGMKKVKEKIIECLIANSNATERGARILLVGRPGIGKTTIAEAIAEAARLPYGEVYLNTSTSSIDIKGLASSYNDADVGKIVDEFFKFGTSEMVIMLDEIDKIGTGTKDGNPAYALLDTLSDKNRCYDAFLSMAIDTSNTIYIATANSTNPIPDFLLNRFEIIRIDDYEDEEKYEIAVRYIIPRLMAQFGLHKNDIIFSDAAIKDIIREFCSDAGARMLKDNIQSIIRKVLTDWNKKQKKDRTQITKEFVHTCLERFIDDKDPALLYTRHKRSFSPEVRKEIEETFERISSAGQDSVKKETDLRRVGYLTTLLPQKKSFEGFDARKLFDKLDSSHFGMFDVKAKIAMDINAKALKGCSFSSERILLVGSAGIGKTSICESIAAGLGIPHVRIKLNGVNDESAIKGFPPTYLNSDAGEIIKGLARARTTCAVVQLDEIDKLGSHNGIKVSNAFFDLLDDSAQFTDRYLGVAIDLSNVLFIATANDISHIEPWLLDRFQVINLSGYTKKDKESILYNYIVPRIEEEFSSRKIRVELDMAATKLLIGQYCTSMGVRDLEKAVRDIVNKKLFSEPDCREIAIGEDDVIEALGPAPIPRGNLTNKIISGVVKALAVTSENRGMAFSIETVVMPFDSDSVITGLPQESTIDSVKLAKTYIRVNYPEYEKDFGMHLHFGEGAVVKDGPSAGVAILISILSAVCGKPTTIDAAYTGEIDLFGNVFAVGGILAKIQGAEECGCTKVFIPAENYKRLSQKEIDQFSVEIVPVSHVSEVIKIVFPSIDHGYQNKVC